MQSSMLAAENFRLLRSEEIEESKFSAPLQGGVGILRPFEISLKKIFQFLARGQAATSILACVSVIVFNPPSPSRLQFPSDLA